MDAFGQPLAADVSACMTLAGVGVPAAPPAAAPLPALVASSAAPAPPLTLAAFFAFGARSLDFVDRRLLVAMDVLLALTGSGDL
jgi:hypothetical protein